MTQPLFGAPRAGGSFSENLRRALDFANANARTTGTAPAAATPAVEAIAAEVATEIAEPAAVRASSPDELIAAVRAAVTDAIASVKAPKAASGVQRITGGASGAAIADAVDSVSKAVKGGVRSGLVDDLRQAAQFVAKVR